MDLTVTGTVIAVDNQKGTSSAGREWQKKVFVIEFMEGTYQKHLAFELFGEEKINNNPFRKGQTVTVHYDIESTEWNGRWFTSCKAWKVEKYDPSNQPAAPQIPVYTPPSTAMVEVTDDKSELPF